MIDITESAKIRIIDLLNKENNPSLMLRTFVQGGGCSGFSYGFTFDEEQQSDDWEFAVGDYKLLIDAISANYLAGATIDFTESVAGSQFTISNPNASSSCGCGSSFSV
jgi:iron-sulfur cluster insertion protein